MTSSAHLKSVCMTYFQHMKFSMSLSKDFLSASAKAFIHGVYPGAFITSSTDAVEDIKNKMKIVGCDKSLNNYED